MRTFSYTNKTTFFMKHLKKLFTLLILLTLIFGSWTLASESPLSSPTKSLKPIPAKLSSTTNVGSGATNILFQSTDGGQTWQDISQGLPENEEPEGFVAGESGLYLRVNNVMYHSKSDLSVPVWEQDNFPDLENTSLAFNRSGVIAYTYEGKMYQRKSPADPDPDSYREWLPVYPNLKKVGMRRIFETSDGTVFIGYDHGLYKSVDSGQRWKNVQNEGLVSEMVESEGVLLATGLKGIMRSTDKGEHWEWVISEGGVGIDVEPIDGGFAAIAFNTKTQSRRVHISTDGGKTWEALNEGLPPSMSISSIKQMGKYLLCGHPDGIFRSSDMGKTWTRVHPAVEEFMYTTFRINSTQPVNDTRRKVFNIYASGNTLYAVARNAGC
jgi:photosystem II stability/assembly factor-like uncharacterized protein